MANEIRFAGDVTPRSASRRRWSVSLLAAIGLWMVAVGQLLVSVPRSVVIAQNFNLKLPWYMEVVRGTPVWTLVVAAVTVILFSGWFRGWRRSVLLVGVPVLVVVAIHLSVYGTQSKLLWGLLH